MRRQLVLSVNQFLLGSVRVNWSVGNGHVSAVLFSQAVKFARLSEMWMVFTFPKFCVTNRSNILLKVKCG